MTKLSLTQIDDANMIDDLDCEIECEIDEAVYRTSYQRKELRSNRQREEGELIGKGSIRKHRKF